MAPGMEMETADGNKTRALRFVVLVGILKLVGTSHNPDDLAKCATRSGLLTT